MVGMAFMAWALGADLRSVVAGDSLIEKINGTRESINIIGSPEGRWLPSSINVTRALSAFKKEVRFLLKKILSRLINLAGSTLFYKLFFQG